MFVEKWMTKNVITCRPDMSILDALKLMEKKKIRRLPVVEDEKVVGIVTKADILSYVGPIPLKGKKQRRGAGKIVRDIMKTNVIFTNSKSTIEKAALEMKDNKISTLPIIDNNKLVGIITETDIFKAFVEVMAIREQSARMTYSFSSADEITKTLSDLANDFHILSFIVYYDRDNSKWNAVARFRGKEKIAKPKIKKLKSKKSQVKSNDSQD